MQHQVWYRSHFGGWVPWRRFDDETLARQAAAELGKETRITGGLWMLRGGTKR